MSEGRPVMELTHRVFIDLRVFALTGRFDFIELGMTEGEVLAVFPEPDDRSVNGRIWRYGAIEFHFHERRLTAIYSDRIGSMEGGARLTLSPWVTNAVPRVSLSGLTDRLISERAPYSVEFVEPLEQAVVTIRRSGVRFAFEDFGAGLGALYLTSGAETVGG